MNELFSNDYIELSTYYKVEKNKFGVKNVVILDEEEYNKLRLDENKKKIVKSLKTKWKMPNWKMGHELLESATFFNAQKGDNDINWHAYRDRRFKASLVSWDAKDDNGQEIPCTAETLDMLHQTIAFALLNQFDKATSMTQEDDEKNV